MAEEHYKVRTPVFAPYSETRHVLRSIDGVPKPVVTGMIQSLWRQTGTPQNPVDWSDPDTWIPQRLSGPERDLALRVWNAGHGGANPRHIYGSYLFINNYELAVPDAQGTYRVSERGHGFLAEEAAVLRQLDDAEGLLELLGILATKSRAKRGDMLPEWAEYLRLNSKFGKPSTISDTLWRRLQNLVDRELVAREGNAYAITARGAEYAATAAPTATDPRKHVQAAIRSYNESQREALHERLLAMAPYRFEQLICQLLEAMGYEDVVVTQESGDKGVDVTAKVQFGITTVKETVQVKRHKGSTGRPVLDQLRGALPYHGAIRGTLITVGSFSKGCEEAALFPGAAPITLIDGDRLLDLLIDHEIGLRKRPTSLYEIDEALFAAQDDEDPVTELEVGQENAGGDDAALPTVGLGDQPGVAP